MKKVSLLLAVLLVLTCCLLAACGDDGDTSSAANTSSTNTSSAASSGNETTSAASSAAESSKVEESSVVDETTSDETTSDETTTDETTTDETTSDDESSTPETSGSTGIENTNGENLALGKSYTGADPSTHDGVKQYNAKLTDGEKATELKTDPGVWFAYYYNTEATGDQVNAPGQVGTFVLDLEAVYAISSVKINTFVGNNWGIQPPKSIKVEYSADGSNYSKLDEKSFTTPTEEGTVVELVEFKNGGTVDARYIRVTVELQGIFAFFNEIEVY